MVTIRGWLLYKVQHLNGRYGTNHSQVKHNTRMCVHLFCVLPGQSCGCMLYHSITREFVTQVFNNALQSPIHMLFTSPVLCILVASYVYLTARVITHQIDTYVASFMIECITSFKFFSKSLKDNMALYRIWCMHKILQVTQAS